MTVLMRVPDGRGVVQNRENKSFIEVVHARRARQLQGTVEEADKFFGFGAYSFNVTAPGES